MNLIEKYLFKMSGGEIDNYTAKSIKNKWIFIVLLIFIDALLSSLIINRTLQNFISQIQSFILTVISFFFIFFSSKSLAMLANSRSKITPLIVNGAFHWIKAFLLTTIIFLSLFIPQIVEEISVISERSISTELNEFYKTLSSLNKEILLPTILIIFILFVLGFLPTLIIQDIKKSGLESKLSLQESIKQQVQIFKSVKHEIGNKLPALQLDFNSIKHLIEQKTIEGSGAKLTDKIRWFPGEDLYDIDTLEIILNRNLKRIEYSINIVGQMESIVNADLSRFAPQKKDLFLWLKNEVHFDINNQNIHLQFVGNEGHIVNIDTRQMEIVINNLVKNAIHHGFANLPDKIIQFEVSELNNSIILIVKNNGNPIDTKLKIDDFVKAYYYHGNTGKSGLGGYLIKKVLVNHGATIDILKATPDEEFQTKFIVKFKKAN